MKLIVTKKELEHLKMVCNYNECPGCKYSRECMMLQELGSYIPQYYDKKRIDDVLEKTKQLKQIGG